QKAQGAGPSQHHGVAELDVAPLHGVDGAGQRLYQHAILATDVAGHLVDARVGAEAHVLGPAAIALLLEPIHVVDFAHPVLASAPANARGVDLDDVLTGAGLGLVDLLEPIVARGVVADCEHHVTHGDSSVCRFLSSPGRAQALALNVAFASFAAARVNSFRGD